MNRYARVASANPSPRGAPARDAGSSPVVLLTASLLAHDQTILQITNDEGTPTP